MESTTKHRHEGTRADYGSAVFTRCATEGCDAILGGVINGTEHWVFPNTGGERRKDTQPVR